MKFYFLLLFIENNSQLSKYLQQNTDDLLQNVSFELRADELLVIIGPVGSGKSTLLLALLNELENIRGHVKINGSVFYVAQEPWIYSATLKENILFGSEYNEAKLAKILDVCELNEDLKGFAHAENTMIGEKGVNLSGGQRTRVSLARALYSDSDIYLFDDPLSSLDVQVAKKIYNK